MNSVNSNILIINGGSSSIKFALYGMDEKLKKILSGQIKRIGLDNPEFSVAHNLTHEKNEIIIDTTNFKEAAELLIEWLKKQKYFEETACIGHRIVHGMNHTHPEIIDESLLKELNKISEYDPDHLPAEIGIIEFFKKQFPQLLQVACFDTSFHTTMPRVAKILPIPCRFDKSGIQRYGFHGLSFTYLMETLKNINAKDESKGRIILAHLGNGASLAAVKDGRSLDTTMGFTPAGGLVMGTRPGDLDPGVAWYMMHGEGMTAAKFNQLINHESGLLGVSETSSDMQDLLQKENEDVKVTEAVDLFCYSVKKWIGAFTAVLNGLDTLVFSGGIGENAPVIRSRICKEFDYLGIEIDEEENKKNATVISTGKSNVKVYMIPTDEEIIIAKSTKELFINSKNKT
ncbi:MAG: acetate/propionate family kinase [Bacteroidia bacterium]|nr:acetate/propionate family kinase [Bacteroidia bacterium]